MKTIEGNILDIKKGIIVQQVNCKGVMGAGLAKQIRNRYPKVFTEYKNHIDYCKNNNPAYLLGSVLGVGISGELGIFNFFSQDDYGIIGLHTDYDAFEKCLKKLVFRFKNSGLDITKFDIYFPYGIGCGLGGGDWGIIYALIEKYIPTAVIVKYKYK